MMDASLPCLPRRALLMVGRKAQVYIDGAHGKEELMKGQVIVVVLVFVFPDDVREVTYQRGAWPKTPSLLLG